MLWWWFLAIFPNVLRKMTVFCKANVLCMLTMVSFRVICFGENKYVLIYRIAPWKGWPIRERALKRPSLVRATRWFCAKIAKNVVHSLLLSKCIQIYVTMHVKSVPCERISATCVIFKPLSERRKSPKYSCPVLILHKYGSGVDVMITIFCDFYQFSAKKLAFFSKPMLRSLFLQKLALFWVKTP
jgi:hypothetical protein